MVPDPILTIDNLRAGYGKLTILHDLSVEIAAQRFTAVLGPNGSGKSTLLKSIFGMATVTGGSIRMRQRALVGVPTERVGRAGIAYVPQRNNVFADMTVRENLLLAVRNLDRRASARLLDEVYALFPLLNKRHQQCADSMSGGERQMLAIGRALMSKPRLLMLDEPSFGLAPIMVQNMFEMIKEINRQGVTVLLIEQNVRAALEVAHRAYVIENGRIAGEGSGENLLFFESVRTAYLA